MRKMSMFAASALAIAAMSGMQAVVASDSQQSATAGSSAPREASPAKPQKSPTTRPGDTNGRMGWARYLGGPPRYPKPGWSVKKGQRMARKRRNVLANRRAQR